MNICPCKDCDKRYLACHSYCTLYKSWKKEWDELKKRDDIELIDYKQQQKSKKIRYTLNHYRKNK